MAAGPSAPEMSAMLGASLRTLRLAHDVNQRQLAALAGISLHAVTNLERGHGASLRSLIQVLRVLGREEWFRLLEPAANSPDTGSPNTKPRQRARRRKGANGK